MGKLLVELGKFHIEYETRTNIKSHVSADFIAEFPRNTLIERGNTLPAPTKGARYKNGSSRSTS